MSSSGNEFKKYISLISKNKRLFAVISLTIMTLAVMASYLLPKKYEATSTVFIEKNVIGELVKGITVTPSMDDSIKVLTYALNSRTLVMKVINELDYFNLKAKSDAEIEQLLNEIQQDTEIKVKDKDLFTISFKHSNPRIARDYVNTLVRSYIEESISSKREESYGASKFLSDQIVTFKEKMEKAEAAVAQYKASQGGVIGLDESNLLREIGTAQQKLYDLQLRRRLLEGQQAYAKKAADPLVSTLKGLQKKLDELRVNFTDDYPEVRSVKSHIESLQEELRSHKSLSPGSGDPQEAWKIETELNAIKETEGNLKRYIEANQKLVNQVPIARAGLQKLEADKMNQRNMYDMLFLRKDQSEVSKQMELQDKSTTFRIVDPAVAPVVPVSPNRKKIIMMGIFAGIAGGVGILLLLDIVDQSITMVSALKPLGLPVLAVIPLIKAPEEIRAERKKDLQLYFICGVYFSLILAVLVMEMLGLNVVDTMVNKFNLPQLASRVMYRLK